MTTPPTDDELRAAIMDAADPMAFVRALHAFYADADRAGRASRELMYLHIGMACGMIMRGQEPRP